jgi:hypothetical protein
MRCRAESRLRRRLFGSILRRVWALCPSHRLTGGAVTVYGWAKKGGRAEEVSEKCRRGRAAGQIPAGPKVVIKARSRRQRMSTGAQARWRIMRLTNDGQAGNVGKHGACGPGICARVSKRRRLWRTPRDSDHLDMTGSFSPAWPHSSSQSRSAAGSEHLGSRASASPVAGSVVGSVLLDAASYGLAGLPAIARRSFHGVMPP